MGTTVFIIAHLLALIVFWPLIIATAIAHVFYEVARPKKSTVRNIVPAAPPTNRGPKPSNK